MSRSEESISEHHEAPRDDCYRDEYKLLDTILSDISDAVIAQDSYVHKQPRRVFVQVVPEKLEEVILYMQDKHKMWQFSTLSGRDLGDDLQAVYHFFLTDERISISFRVNVPRSKPEYPSITHLIPGAEFVENELRELFGVVPVGHPKVRRVELPENWPKDEFPLRKDWTDPRGLLTRSKTTGAKPQEEL